MNNQTIVKQIIHATQLPYDYALSKLNTIIRNSGFDPETIELHELRPILAQFLQETLSEAKEYYSQEA